MSTRLKILAAGDGLTFVAADLLSDAGWTEAVAGCTYVLHVASPYPADSPENEDDLVSPHRLEFRTGYRAGGQAGCLVSERCLHRSHHMLRRRFIKYEHLH